MHHIEKAITKKQWHIESLPKDSPDLPVLQAELDELKKQLKESNVENS